MQVRKDTKTNWKVVACNLIVTETAEQHALGAAMYYENQQTGLGDRFLNELEKAYQKIAEHPQ